MEFFASPEFAGQLSALGQVLMIDLVLAGDNAVAVGLAAAALPPEQRKKAILIGLAVAGAAHEHPWIMVFGLILSITLMGVAATFIARILTRHRWIGYVGLVIVLYVALHMVWDGYRASVVRTLNVGKHNDSVPSLLDISPREVAKFCKAETGEKLQICLRQPLSDAPAPTARAIIP